jgi:mono/diheme cytochrome c family protein
VRAASLVLAVLAAAPSAGCRKDEEAREWRASDHDHTAAPNAGQAPVGADGGIVRPPIPGLDEVTLVAWRRSCASCHGTLGRGDGPQGPSTRARDLSDPSWQASVSDAEIARVIRDGRGAMPKFDLPQATLEGLVRLVRLFDTTRRADAGSARAAPPAASAAASVAPASAVSVAPATRSPIAPPARQAPPGAIR